MTSDNDLTDTVARAICAEQCAVYGEQPCHRVGLWPNPNCDKLGCMALAQAASAAIPASPMTLAQAMAVPELLALVEAAKDALTVLEEYNMGLSSPVICDLVAALAAWGSITASKEGEQ